MNEANRRPKILIADAISEAGIDILREHFDVDVRTGLDQGALRATISDYEGIVVRSATELPAGRMGEPAEVAELVAFLGSPRSSYITGHVHVIGGGRSLT